MKALILPGLIILLSVLNACSVNPVTGDRQLSIVSEAQELQIGERHYGPSQQQQGGAYVVDSTLTPYVNRIGQRLAQLSDRPELPYEFVVLNNDVPNAWALPGGKIAINRGLLVLLEDEAQLAAVLGHEVVHAAARHGATQQTQQTLLGVGVAVAGIASAKNEYGQLIGLGSAAGASAWQAHYGRSQELESDEYGMKYMLAAGYEPQAAVELQQTFMKLSEGRKSDFFSQLFASHPPSQERVHKNQARAKNMPSGKRNRAEYQQAIAQIKKDAPAYALHNEALAAAGKKDVPTAKQKLDKAIALQPKEALFHITKGKLLLSDKSTNTQAHAAFVKAYALNPGYYVAPLGLGLTENMKKNSDKAQRYLQESVNIMPTQIAVYYLGDIALGKGDKKQAAEYYKAAAQGGGQLGQAASKKLDQILAP